MTVAQLPFMHIWPLAQVLPQAPQFLASVCSFTQALVHRVCPLGQLHAPAAQVWPVPQVLPQAPQFLASVCSLTQAVVQYD
jgi:hypothetical protein